MSMLADRPTTNTPNGPKGTKLPTGRSVIYNPSAEELQELTSRMPNAKKTSFGNYNVQTSVTSRSVGSTYIIDDDPSKQEMRLTAGSSFVSPQRVDDPPIDR